MSEASKIVRGVVRPDGTLELSGRPNLPAGDVEVLIRPLPAGGEAGPPALPTGPTEVPGETLWQFLQRTRAELEASGHQFQTGEEIDAELEDMRDWDGKIDDVYRQGEEERRRVDPR